MLVDEDLCLQLPLQEKQTKKRLFSNNKLKIFPLWIRNFLQVTIRGHKIGGSSNANNEKTIFLVISIF